MSVVNLEAKFANFADQWSPKIIARLNDLHVKAVKIRGEFVWHRHAETDELFFVHKGRLTIRLRDGGGERAVCIGPGEMFVVPKGMEHMPVAEDECEMLLIEPAGTLNTGDAGGDRTVTQEVWI
ncbi:MAG TPA: cupin domain-containing protein [Alphaproteobacteria bacterium]|jgi:mannose-6-phosphate isomerase-like protein (cupin superfamily)